MDHLSERKAYIKEVLLAACLKYRRLRMGQISQQKKKKEGTKKKRVWVRRWIARRSTLGGEVLLRELAVEDQASYTNALRMSTDRFNELLLGMIEDTIQRKHTQLRLALPARLKLEITLRYLATGDSFKSLSLLFRVPTSSISTFIPEVLRAINAALKSAIKIPESMKEWDAIASHFEMIWNYPRCCGAIDGKHITIKQPPRSGTTFYNFKGFYSIVLFAMVDADYNFVYVDIGSNGSSNDSSIFQQSPLFDALEKGTLKLPPEHVIVGDSAFPLKKYLTKPFSSRGKNTKQTIFNYRLSRARRIVENAFGILTWRFRVFTRPIELKTSTVDEVVLAACSLHNWLRARAPGYISAGLVDDEDTHTGNIIPGQWRKEVTPLTSAKFRASNNYSKDAEGIRQKYADYFWREGAIPGQWRATGIDPTAVDIRLENSRLGANSNNSDDGDESDSLSNTFDVLDSDLEELNDSDECDI